MMSRTRFYTISANPLSLRLIWLVVAFMTAFLATKIRGSIVPLSLFVVLIISCLLYDVFFIESLLLEYKLFRWLQVGRRHDEKTSYSLRLKYAVTDEKILIRGLLDGLSERETTDMLDSTNNQLLQALVHRRLEEFRVAEDYSYVQFEFYKQNDKPLLVSDTLIPNKNNQIQLTTRRVWDLDDSPHMLLSGGTGSGKSYLIMYFLLQFELIQAETVIIDPKMSDLMQFGRYYENGVIGSDAQEVMKKLRDINKELINRQQRKLETGEEEKPFFIVFDEFSAFIAALDRADKKEVEQILSQIILKGRSLRIFLLLSMQRADASILPASLRDQFGLRIALSRTSMDGLTMMYGANAKDLHEMTESQMGYLKTNEMSLPIRFRTPTFNIDIHRTFDSVFKK